MDVVRLLLEHGAEANAHGHDDCTSLHHACAGRHKQVVRLLLEHAADRSMENKNGLTARGAAERGGAHTIVAVLDAYFPIVLQMMQVLLGMGGPTASPLVRLARHSAFERHVLSLVKCLVTGEENAAFEQLQREA